MYIVTIMGRQTVGIREDGRRLVFVPGYFNIGFKFAKVKSKSRKN